MSIIIIGAGEIGYHVARRLSLEKKDVTIIDTNPEKIKKIQESLDVQTLNASGSSLKALRESGIEYADMLIAVTDSDEVNMVSCLVVSAQTKIPTKIARIRNLEYVYNPDILEKGNLNIDLVINPDFEAVSSIIRLFQVPGATDVVDFNEGRVKLIGYKVQNSLFYDGIKLEDLRAKSQIDDLIIVSIYRDGEVTIPRGKNKIYYNDFIYVITSDKNISQTMNFFGRESFEIKKAMVVGGGNIGLLLAKEFEKMKISTKLIESDESRCMKITDELQKTVVLHHSGEFEKILAEEYIEDTDIFVAVTDDEEDNILLSLLAKQKGAKKVIALIQNMTYSQFISSIGIDLVINPNMCAVNRILQFIRKGKILSVASFYERNAEAIEAIALDTSDLVNKPLAKLNFPKDAIIGAIVRDDVLIVPRGDSVISPGDRVIIFALSTAISRVEKMLMVKLEYW
ncbi:Trk system potassium transporter TrkA [Thermodesulfobacteriota bacterium]